MAQGDIIIFEDVAKKLADGTLDLDGHTLKFAFVTLQVGGTPTIAKADADPCWGAGGTTNLSTSEVTPGGGYTAGGNTLGTVTFNEAAGVATLDAANTSFVSAASGDPTDIKTGIIYSDTATNKDAIGYMDMTADGTTAISLLSGDINVNWNASGILTITV